MPIDVAIDLGTYKTVIYSYNRILLEEPTVATVESETFQPICFGSRAKDMVGRTSENIETVFPIQRGMIADYDVAEQMLSEYMSRSIGKRLIKPRVIVAMPSGATSIQRRSVANAVATAGGRSAQIIDTAFAAALGMGIDFSKPGGKLVVDIGAGVTDVAALSAGGIVQCDSVPVGSIDFEEAIIKYVRKEFNVLIGWLTAEEIKLQIGSVVPRSEEVTIKAKGRNLFTGLPQIFDISSSDVYSAMYDVAESICKAIKGVIEKTDPDIVADIMADRVDVAGGGAYVNGMEELLSQYLSCEVRIHRDAEHCVARGAYYALKHPSLLKDIDFELRNIQDLIVE